MNYSGLNLVMKEVKLMSPRNAKNNKPLKDTTTDFFLKIVEKEKALQVKTQSMKKKSKRLIRVLVFIII